MTERTLYYGLQTRTELCPVTGLLLPVPLMASAVVRLRMLLGSPAYTAARRQIMSCLMSVMRSEDYQIGTHKTEKSHHVNQRKKTGQEEKIGRL